MTVPEMSTGPSDFHAKMQVCISVRSRQSESETDTQTNDVKTIIPITSEMWGVIGCNEVQNESI